MSQIIRLTVLLVAVVLFAGCAEWNAIHMGHNFEKKSLLIGVKQRAILAKKDTTKTNNPLMICAEPSPDAMSAYAAELAAKVDLPEAAALELAGAFQESSSYIGMRTASIQMLRDRSYRLCEARMNGFIDDGQFALQMRRQQRNTVALLAIEQLTGALKVPPTTINTEGTAEISKNVDKMVALKDEKDEAIKKKTKERDDITGDSEDDKARKTALQNEIDELTESRNALEKGIKNGRTLTATGSATALVHTTGMHDQRSDAHIQAVAKYVDQIVQYTQTDDFGQMCLIYMNNDKKTAMDGICSDYLKRYSQQQAALTNVIKIFSQKMDATKIKNAQDLKTIAQALQILSEIGSNTGLIGIKPGTFKNANPNELLDK